MWTGARFDEKADIWALGCTILEMILGYEGFRDPDGKDWREDKCHPKTGKRLKWVTKHLSKEVLDTDSWTYNRFNPWNLMGSEEVLR